MRKAYPLLAALSMLSGCEDYAPQAAAYRDPLDRLMVSTGLTGLLFDYPCRDIEAVAHDYYEQCYQFLEPERMQGIWIDAFEDNRFYPGSSRNIPDYEEDEHRLMLVINNRSLPPSLGVRPDGGRLIDIEFVGRRTKVPGPYHQTREHIILVDRVLSARKIGRWGGL